ncbi:MAG: hypothetical protein QM727_15360 [Niabella sp.]
MKGFRKSRTFGKILYPKMFVKRLSILFIACLLAANSCLAAHDSLPTSTAEMALQYLNGIKKLERSKYWPNVDPAIFLENLKTFTVYPLAFYEGKATNFCAYSALTYIPLHYDPLGFSKFMINLYKHGQALMGKTVSAPGKRVREEAGLLKYKGALDINPAGQMWFLALADEFKGYINMFNLHFNKGDENTFWASTNFAKFNRMLRRLFLLKTNAVGADLIRPHKEDIAQYMSDELKKGIVFVYLNNKKLYRKTHTKSIINTPTHFVMLISSNKLPDGRIEFIYWDYGLKTLRLLTPGFLKNIVYGVTTVTFKS